MAGFFSKIGQVFDNAGSDSQRAVATITAGNRFAGIMHDYIQPEDAKLSDVALAQAVIARFEKDHGKA
jgi:hypothetical protein